MRKKMTWEEIKKAFPDEWVAIVNYKSNEFGNVDGEVASHSSNKDAFYSKLKSLVKKYGDVAMEYTGERIKHPEVPLLWQISHLK